MKTIRLLVVTFIMGSIILSSCEQANEQLTKADSDAIQAIIGITDLYNTEDAEEATSTDGTKSELTNPACFELTINQNEDGAFWPRSWTLDFGTEGCESFNGVYRQGKIHITLTDHWRVEGSLRTITFEDFYVDSVKLEGVKTIENTGLNDAENMTWTRKMTDGKLTYPDGTVTTWNCERNSELVEGGDTWLFFDDIYLVTGGGSGITQDGLAFTVEITAPLEYIFGCRFPVSGELSISIEGAEQVTINYGEGECDNMATQTTGNDSVEIELGNR